MIYFKSVELHRAAVYYFSNGLHVWYCNSDCNNEADMREEMAYLTALLSRACQVKYLDYIKWIFDFDNFCTHILRRHFGIALRK